MNGPIVRRTFKNRGGLFAMFRGLLRWWADLVKRSKRDDVLGFLADCFSVIEDAGQAVNSVYMNANTYRLVRVMLGDQFDPVTRKELLKNGYMGDVWCAAIRIDKGLRDNEVVCTADEVKTAGKGDDVRILSFTEWEESTAPQTPVVA